MAKDEELERLRAENKRLCELLQRKDEELQQSRKRVEALNADIHQLEKENARLRAEIDSVKKSTFAVERIAREDLGMSRKGEVIYLLPANSQPR